jgi:hypothetical protein
VISEYQVHKGCIYSPSTVDKGSMIRTTWYDQMGMIYDTVYFLDKLSELSKSYDAEARSLLWHHPSPDKVELIVNLDLWVYFLLH